MNNKLDAYNKRRQHETTRRKTKTPTPPILNLISTLPCIQCGHPPISEVHHLIPKSKWTKTQKQNNEHNTPENLIPLCHQNHHTTAHKRIPRTKLNNTQTTHLLHKQGEAWADKWYPKNQN